jgi:uroporphyrinogen III methyltransferase/synthase
VEPEGCVYLVGAGPGDPGLLTVRGAELIASAGDIVYDALVSPELLAGRAEDAELVFVGKRGGMPSPTQEEVNRILLELAGRHARVVRLKGGDPFVFGRGGEEALALRRAGVPFEIVPGVTAGIAVPAYAGIPVTHRGIASSVTFVTGHDDPARSDGRIDWERLARSAGTVVFYMGVRRLRENCRHLIAAGRPPHTPAAVIEWGTYPRQRTIVGTLESLPARVEEAGITSPAITVVGEVVSLRESLAWYEDRPLFGRRVVVTRARAQASEFGAALTLLGAEVIHFPTIRVIEPEDPEPLRRAVRKAEEYDWIVFTSVNGVQRFWSELRASGRDTRVLGGVSLCAIGSATAAALELEGARADLVPGEYVAEAVVAALAAETELRGSHLLFARAEAARPILPESLRALGAVVDDVIAYRTVQDGSAAQRVSRALQTGSIDLVTFTSSSTVRNFVELVGTEIGGATVASIGPITSATAREFGLPVHVEASEHTIPGLIAAIEGHLRATPS